MPEDRTRNLAGRLSESAERHSDYSPNTGVTRESMSTAAGHLSYLIAGPDSGPSPDMGTTDRRAIRRGLSSGGPGHARVRQLLQAG
jgi:hypothetical protein